MIEAAAQLYCIPEIDYTLQTYIVEGKQVLVATIEENPHKPVYAKDENGKPLAYLRIKDENILATPIHLACMATKRQPAGGTDPAIRNANNSCSTCWNRERCFHSTGIAGRPVFPDVPLNICLPNLFGMI